MKMYKIIYRREVLTDLEFEIEAKNLEEAEELAQEEFESMDWDYINENEGLWAVDSIEEYENEEVQP